MREREREGEEREGEEREGEVERRERKRGDRGEMVHSLNGRVEGIYCENEAGGKGDRGDGNIVLASVVQPRQAPDPKKVTEGNEVQKWMRDATM
jgi:hypothetical protein